MVCVWAITLGSLFTWRCKYVNFFRVISRTILGHNGSWLVYMRQLSATSSHGYIFTFILYSVTESKSWISKLWAIIYGNLSYKTEISFLPFLFFLFGFKEKKMVIIYWLDSYRQFELHKLQQFYCSTISISFVVLR